MHFILRQGTPSPMTSTDSRHFSLHYGWQLLPDMVYYRHDSSVVFSSPIWRVVKKVYAMVFIKIELFIKLSFFDFFDFFYVFTFFLIFTWKCEIKPFLFIQNLPHK